MFYEHFVKLENDVRPNMDWNYVFIFPDGFTKAVSIKNGKKKKTVGNIVISLDLYFLFPPLPYLPHFVFALVWE